MGSSHSKSNGKVLSTQPPPKLPPEPSYLGPPAQYQFINTQVIIGTQLSFSFTQTPMVTSNIDTYYPLLAARYAEGYRLLSFYRIPGQMQAQGFFSTTVAVGFQGIFCRYPHTPPRENWQLRVEKSVIQTQRMFTGIISLQHAAVSDTSHILESIARNTQGGGRLVCIEMTGQVQRASVGMAMHGVSPMMGVDVFFEVPHQPLSEQYVYNCVAVPILVTVQMGFRPRPICQCDWLGNLAAQLNQGWRLIEIFMDQSHHTQNKAFSGQMTLSSLWFFEKPASRLNDPTPLYQGIVIDHQIKIQQGFMGVNTSANWEPVIQEMGNKGWELACILETPEYEISGFGTIIMTCKLFFQRLILPPLHGGAHAAGAPPSYDAAVGREPVGFVPPAPEHIGY